MSYQIAGRAIKNEYLALGTILSTAAIAVASMSGDKKAPAPVEQQTNIEASSRARVTFIRSRHTRIAAPKLCLKGDGDGQESATHRRRRVYVNELRAATAIRRMHMRFVRS
ncbi:hypothetical protein QFC21_001140 [Naganishia friedmannii]|uniref:Uncharacterized protein n=1 Tax=Naganishia friedmannii TaxID=89922 RepID=A0ACC2W7D2_9TREE|nr:hypothetical protein QFC21_001140 [Naganishia friedmannii]